MQEDMYRGDGLNLYAYCANNSVMYYDPSGYEGNNDLRFCKPKEKPGAPPDEGGEFLIIQENYIYLIRMKFHQQFNQELI